MLLDNGRIIDWNGGQSQNVAQGGAYPQAARHLQLSQTDELRRSSVQPEECQGYCIDEICTCGRHGCPPVDQFVPLLGTTSTYADTYRPINPALYPPRVRPRGDPTDPPPIDGSTTYQNTYRPFDTHSLQTRGGGRPATRAANAPGLAPYAQIGVAGNLIGRVPGRLPSGPNVAPTGKGTGRRLRDGPCPVLSLPPVPKYSANGGHLFFNPCTQDWY